MIVIGKNYLFVGMIADYDGWHKDKILVYADGYTEALTKIQGDSSVKDCIFIEEVYLGSKYYQEVIDWLNS